MDLRVAISVHFELGCVLTTQMTEQDEDFVDRQIRDVCMKTDFEK